jgi:hypothetical protein
MSILTDYRKTQKIQCEYKQERRDYRLILGYRRSFFGYGNTRRDQKEHHDKGASGQEDEAHVISFRIDLEIRETAFEIKRYDDGRKECKNSREHQSAYYPSFLTYEILSSVYKKPDKKCPCKT